MKTLKEILDAPRFSEFQLLTPDVDIHIPVSRVEITETPDIAKYTSSNTLILTTAMYYQNQQDKMKELIDSLKEIQGSGLVVKLGRFITEINAEVIEYAVQKNFPLLTIPVTKPLGVELQKITSFINQSKSEQMNFALDIQKQFSNLVIQEAPLEKIIDEMKKIIGCPILLLDPFKEVISYSKDFYHFEYGVERIIQTLTKEKAFSNQPTAQFVYTGHRIKVEAMVHPIKVNNYFPYYLVILSPEKVPYNVSEFTIEQALLILSFTILRNEKSIESKKQLKSDYFFSLLDDQDNRMTDYKRWLSYDVHLGIQFSHFYQVIYVSLQDIKESHFLKLNEEKMNLVYWWITRKLENYFPEAVCFPERNSINLIILLQEEYSSQEIADHLENIAYGLSATLPIDIVFSCGRACSSIENVPSSFIEANLVYDERKMQDNKQVVLFYRPKGLLQLLNHFQPDELKYFCQTILKELAFPTEATLVELKRTLKVFLDNQCEITKTATELYIHRNTVKYRIDNCETILGQSISDPENSLEIRLALKLSETIEI